MSAPARLRALLAEPGFVVMPAVWDGLTAKLSAAAGYRPALHTDRVLFAQGIPYGVCGVSP